MNILIPAAGSGSRFVAEGYKRPKPLIQIGDTTMLHKVVLSVHDLCFFNAKLITIMQKEHLDGFYPYEGQQENGKTGYQGRTLVDTALFCWDGYTKLVEINQLTGGAVDTTLLATKYIANDEELLIVNSDQYVDVDWIEFINYARQFDGCLLTFTSDGDPKWSYCEVNNYNGVDLVDRVEEKQPLPKNIANCGIYYFKTGLLYLNAVASMIEKDIRVNGEFYVAKVFSELVREYRISNYHILDRKFSPLGTPQDLKNSISKENW
jgi:NDP-sugar pyrophosphorylase family protein